MKRGVILTALVAVAIQLYGSPVEKGFAALAEYDYFKARKIFRQSLHKRKLAPYAGYGLALIYSRNDNPFYNLDSAGFHATRSYNLFKAEKKVAVFGAFKIDSTAILGLAQNIAERKLQSPGAYTTVQALEEFLTDFYLAGKTIRAQAVRMRDEIVFTQVSEANNSRATNHFLLTHPRSEFFAETLQLKDRQVFEELTADKKPASYISFLHKFPGSVMRNTAYEELYAVYRKYSDIKGLSEFVKNFPEAPQHLEAWKLLFSLSVRAHTYAELKKFIDEYPEFPFKNSILRELELNKLVLHPYRKGGYAGYVDATGKPTIHAMYEEVTLFSEGLAVVHFGDSACFINKENVNPLGRCFGEAMLFRNGIAAVREGKRWHFINRLGQTVSKEYEEINELSDGLYVVKSGDRFGALDQFGQVVIEPKFQKLGDFTNGFAYYTENGRYGFVSKSGFASKAEFDWISEFSDARIAIFRRQGRFGLVHTSGTKLFDAVYDLILKSSSGVYVAVQANQYGFIHPQGCFISFIGNEFQRDKDADFYTNGELYRLTKKGEYALIDENGHQVVPFGQFEEIGFPSAGLMAVKKKKKSGYVDRKLNVQIPLKFTNAGDFSDSIAVVSLHDRNFMIDIKGNELLSTSSPIEKLTSRLYYLPEERRVVNHAGATVVTGIAEIQDREKTPLIIITTSGEIKVIER